MAHPTKTTLEDRELGDDAKPTDGDCSPRTNAPRLSRQPGRLKGKIWMADDFETWPEGFLDAMGAPLFDGDPAPSRETGGS